MSRPDVPRPRSLDEAEKLLGELVKENETLRIVLARVQGENLRLSESLLRAMNAHAVGAAHRDDEYSP